MTPGVVLVVYSPTYHTNLVYHYMFRVITVHSLSNCASIARGRCIDVQAFDAGAGRSMYSSFRLSDDWLLSCQILYQFHISVWKLTTEFRFHFIFPRSPVAAFGGHIVMMTSSMTSQCEHYQMLAQDTLFTLGVMLSCIVFFVMLRCLKWWIFIDIWLADINFPRSGTLFEFHVVITDASR